MVAFVARATAVCRWLVGWLAVVVVIVVVVVAVVVVVGVLLLWSLMLLLLFSLLFVLLWLLLWLHWCMLLTPTTTNNITISTNNKGLQLHNNDLAFAHGAFTHGHCFHLGHGSGFHTWLWHLLMPLAFTYMHMPRLVPTKKPFNLCQKTPHLISKNPEANTKKPPILCQKPSRLYQKTPRLYPKIPLVTLLEWTTTNPICTYKNTLSTKKKNSYLPQVCYTCGPLCTKEPTWLPPFIQKKPRMGYLAVSSFPPLTTTHTPLLDPSTILRGLSHLIP